MSLRTFARHVVPPALRYEAHRFSARIAALAGLARVWRWEISSLARGRDYRVLYLGLADQRAHTAALLNLDRDDATPTSPRVTDTTAVVTHARLPNALRVPQRVQMVVPLRRPFDEVLRHFDPAVQRRLARQRHAYGSRQAKDPKEIEQLTDTMLEPYARHPRGAGVWPIDREQLRRVALGEGRFDVLFRDQQIVACRVGYPRRVGDSHFWVLWRTGYAPEVLADERQLDDVHAMNVFIDLEHAIAAGCNYFDMGSCLSQPLDPHVQWRRRRGGLPVALQTHEWLSVMLPRRGAARLLWDAPQLASDYGHLSLWLGHPAQRSDDELIERCRALTFDGLMRLHLHCEREPRRTLRAALESLFAGCIQKPELVTLRAA